MPSLSIIIPAYNVEAYLKQCLDSVLVDNTFTGQIVCVNDGSTDGSATILAEYAAQYSNVEIITQPNAGLSAARNAGLDRAIGQYVFFLDSDDWVMPKSLEKIMKQIEGEDVVYFNAERYYDDSNNYGGKYDIVELKHESGEKFLEATIHNERRGMPFVTVGGKLYKRSFLKANRLYNEPGIYHEDSYFTPQVLLAAKDVSCINEYVYIYRIRQGSITAKLTEKHIKDMLYIARNLYVKYKQRKDVADVFYVDLCNIYIYMINAAYDNNIPLHKLWNISDGQRMLRCAYDDRSKKIARLAFLSPYQAYRYMQNELSVKARRFVNRFL